MSNPKVLIAAPIAGAKQYSMGDWLEWIARQNYPIDSFDVCLCANGESAKDLLKQINESEIEYPNHTKKIIGLELKNSNELTIIQKITYAREMIRRYAVENEFDYIFFLDTDTIPLNLDAIQELINQEKDVVSGVYFYKSSKVPVIIDIETSTNVSIEKLAKSFGESSSIECWGFGFGCLLLSRKAFESAEFDYNLFKEERTDDFGYCEVLSQLGIRRYYYGRVVCIHLENPEKDNLGSPFPFKVKEGKRL